MEKWYLYEGWQWSPRQVGECQGCSQHRNVCSFKLDQIGILNSLCTFQSLEQANKNAACSLENVKGSKTTPTLIQIHIIGTLNTTKSPSFHLPSTPSSSFALCTGSHDSTHSLKRNGFGFFHSKLGLQSSANVNWFVLSSLRRSRHAWRAVCADVSPQILSRPSQLDHSILYRIYSVSRIKNVL